MCVLFCLSLSCPADYAGAQCQFPNPCSPSPCRNGGVCRPRTQGNDVDFTCDCTLGFSGPLCLTPVNHACMSSPCRNGGSCSLLTLSTYSCRCPPGWTGTYINSHLNLDALYNNACISSINAPHKIYVVQVRHVNRQTRVHQTPVRTVVGAQHLTPTLSAHVRQASMGPHAAWM